MICLYTLFFCFFYVCGALRNLHLSIRRQRQMCIRDSTDNAFIRQRVEETLKGAALWDEVKDKLKVSAYALSGGQQQRLCIARAMAVSPSVLLMDEPASALDPISTAKVEELIHELKKQYTIVIVTHNMQQAARVSDNTAFFYMGQMLSLIHISEPTRQAEISYAVFCLKKKNNQHTNTPTSIFTPHPHILPPHLLCRL